MKAVVLAGGVRSGMEIPGSGLPRALWPFPSEPLITAVLSFLKNQGVSEIAICANGKTKLIASQLSAGPKPWLDIHYSEDPLPRGPAGCLRDLQEWLGDDTFVAIQATAHYDFDLAAMERDHRASAAAITVAARACVDDPQQLEPAGVYLINPQTLSFIQPVGYQDLKEQFLAKVIAAGMPVQCHQLQGTATLIHSPGHYLTAVGEAIQRSLSTLPAGYREIQPGVVAHESAQVSPDARLAGPIWIDAGARVEDDAILTGPVLVGPRALIGARALVHRTVAMRDSSIEAGAEVFSTVLAPNAVRRSGPTITLRPHAISAARRGFFARVLSRLAPAAAC
ncbi:MAG TPA: NDP-sugar synthase [Phycisphaerae bacterium]|nr:NDP-sugar synthase [Phycisphaerae bacterium]